MRLFPDAQLSLNAIILVFSLLPCVKGGERVSPTVHMAVLDLQGPKAQSWLGPAVSESLRVRLSQLPNTLLLERERTQILAHACLPHPVTADRLGVQWLLIGSVQVIPSSSPQIRIVVRMVASETGITKIPLQS